MLFEDLMRIKIQEVYDFHGIGKWHDMGFKGEGVTIVNLESYSGHGKSTYDTIKEFSPNANIYSADVSYGARGGELTFINAQIDNQKGDRRTLDLQGYEEFLNSVDIVTISMAGSDLPQGLKELYWRTDNILMGSSGNDADAGVTGKFRNTGWSIGAIGLQQGKVIKKSYSAVGEEVDFACLTSFQEGTSFSSPIMSAITALVIQRYGRMPQTKMEEVMKSISIDAGEVGFDTSFGWGVPVLPDSIKMLQTGIGGFLPVNNIHHTPLIQDNILNFKGRESYPMIPDYITIHNFGSLASARDVTKYVDNTDEVKSWHFTVGKDAIYQEMSIFNNGWHAGDGLYGTGNRKSIGIEVEENLDAMMNTVRLVVYLRKLLGRKLEIKFHSDWTNKDCPRWIIKNYSKDIFIRLVEEMEMRFKDVEESRWSFKAIDYVTDKGYMKGFPDGTFKPGEPLTREQMAQVLYNLENSIN
jgi:hypothetical protein